MLDDKVVVSQRCMCIYVFFQKQGGDVTEFCYRCCKSPKSSSWGVLQTKLCYCKSIWSRFRKRNVQDPNCSCIECNAESLTDNWTNQASWFYLYPCYISLVLSTIDVFITHLFCCLLMNIIFILHCKNAYRRLGQKYNSQGLYVISKAFTPFLIYGFLRGKYPFGEYISYTDTAFALSEVKHLWRQNGCLTTYGKHLVIRIDDFQRPRKTNVLCSNWREWEEPIIW